MTNLTYKRSIGIALSVYVIATLLYILHFFHFTILLSLSAFAVAVIFSIRLYNSKSDWEKIYKYGALAGYFLCRAYSINHVPGSDLIALIGIGLLVLWFVLVYVNFGHFPRFEKRYRSTIPGFIILGLGLMIKIMHWTMADLLILLGCTWFVLWLSYHYTFFGIRVPNSGD